jgi:hypothetical protein
MSDQKPLDDPGIPLQGDKNHENSTQAEDEEEKVELVKEGYYTLNDVMFEWAKVLEPWHVSRRIRVLVSR